MSTAIPRLRKKAWVSWGYSVEIRLPGRDIAGAFDILALRHGHHQLDHARSLLAVVEVGHMGHHRSGLHYPVGTGYAQVEVPFGHIARYLLGPQDLHLAYAGIIDAGIVLPLSSLNLQPGLLEELQRLVLQAALGNGYVYHSDVWLFQNIFLSFA